MTNMDHNEAVRLQAAEKYLLGELPKEQHAAFEEHYFDCSACAEEMKATIAFMESARQVVSEDTRQAVEQKRLAPAPPKPGGWFAWLRPAFAVPVFAVLLLFIGYQNGVTIPGLKQEASQSASARIFNSFSFMEVGARGETGLTIKVRPDDEFALEVDFPPVASAGSYVGQIQDAAGRTKFSMPVSLEQAKSTIHVNIPGGSLKAGNYSFVILAVDASSGQTGTTKETKRLPFTVEFEQ
jgi:Putative zinc-finger